MKFKDDVNIQGISVELLVGLIVADGVYAKAGYDLVVTSVLDGNHSDTSLHYSGNAADLRIWGMDRLKAREIRDAIAKALPPGFDVIVETDHLHMERQPKRPS